MATTKKANPAAGPDPRWLASQLGRLGGQSRSTRKAKAARENLERANAAKRRKAKKGGSK